MCSDCVLYFHLTVGMLCKSKRPHIIVSLAVATRQDVFVVSVAGHTRPGVPGCIGAAPHAGGGRQARGAVHGRPCSDLLHQEDREEGESLREVGLFVISGQIAYSSVIALHIGL